MDGFVLDESKSSALDLNKPEPAFILSKQPALEKEDFMDRYSSAKILLRWHQNMKQFIKPGLMYSKKNALATIEANLQQWSENWDNIKFMPNVWRMLPDWRNLTVAPSTFETFHGFDRLKSNLFDFKEEELRERQCILSSDTELLLAYARENDLPFDEVQVRSRTDIQFLKNKKDAFNGFDFEKQRKDLINRLWDIYVKDIEYKEEKKEVSIMADTKFIESMSDDEYGEYLLESIGLVNKEI